MGRPGVDSGPRVRMRGLAAREFSSQINKALPDVIAACKCTVFDLIVVESSGIGQGDAAIVPHVDVPMYVMTPKFDAAGQLEKIDMLDFAEFVAIHKFARKGSDAMRCGQAGTAQQRSLGRANGANARVWHHGRAL